LNSNFKFQNSNSGSGFTLVELLVSIAIIGILSSIILFSITRYINSGKDSNVEGNLAILVPAGEVYYNSYNNSYTGFCDSPVVHITSEQMPHSSDENCHESATPGICCYENSNGDAWAACAREFTDSTMAFCVDSRGYKKLIENERCKDPANTRCE